MGQVPWQVDVHTHAQFVFDLLPALAAKWPKRYRAFTLDGMAALLTFCWTLKSHMAFLDGNAAQLFLFVIHGGKSIATGNSSSATAFWDGSL